MSHRFYSLYNAVKCEVKSASRLALLGEKDRARERLRFIQMSGVVSILREHEFPSVFPVNVALLEWELGQALNECSPDSASENGNRDLFEEILSRLDLIAHHVAGVGHSKISVGVRESKNAAASLERVKLGTC